MPLSQKYEERVQKFFFLTRHHFEVEQGKPLALSLCGLTARIFLN